MKPTFIDHLTVTAPSLEAGAEFVFHSLGVRPSPGGEHVGKGTHNRLLKLGDSVYLEVIAVNPQAPKPSCPYLFGLAHVDSDTPARFATWVARTTSIEETTRNSTEDLGVIEAMSRGALNWEITLPTDGELVLDGMVPALIEWHTSDHPASKMPESGCRLLSVDAYHPDADRVSRLLTSIRLKDNFTVHRLEPGALPYLVATIETPSGIRKLPAAL